MSDIPSIKGAVFAGDVEILKKLLADGSVTREALARRLQKDDLALLDESIAATE